ncbi:MULTISPECIES: hypothetical protein [unclassified Streptomyces]|uniref:hypothetical protein n=1 Tax=unclassified Streptomyces TaxID=2593676 RepID=UPI000DBAC9CF|nr:MULTISPECIES: hypothetical protein [unclassified Streptomyces]MYT73319.1 hypothetical protein [Streptomyces sp. SID8367]RAJ74919.1 hypothetical protein K377_06686 [Streptomyces sp. PsTaAH-137]
MGGHYKTDTDALGKFVASLESSVDELDAARVALSHVRGDQVGTARLDAACDTFQDRWRYGTEQLSEQIGGIAEGVKDNKLSYEELEKNLADALNKFQASTSGGK